MNRKQIIDFCNDSIFPQVELAAGMTLRHMQDTTKMVSRWRIGKNIDIEMNPVVDNGFLYMNGEPLGRIAPKRPTTPHDSGEYYWEGRILARQGL